MQQGSGVFSIETANAPVYPVASKNDFVFFCLSRT